MSWIIWLIIVVLILGVLFWVFRKVMKYMFLISAIVFVFFLVTGLLVYKDVQDLKEKFPTSPNLIILEDQGTTLTGFTLDLSKETTEEKYKFTEKDKFEEFNQYLAEEKYKKLKGDNFKLVILKKDIISELEFEKIDILGIELTKELA